MKPKQYSIEDLWLVVLRADSGEQTSRIWAAPPERTGLRRIYRATTANLVPIAAVPVAEVIATDLQRQPGLIGRMLTGRWFVALVQGDGDIPEIVQVQAKSTSLAINALLSRDQELRALLSQEEVYADASQARAIIAGEFSPDRDLVANPPGHSSDPRPSPAEKLQHIEHSDVWAKVRK